MILMENSYFICCKFEAKTNTYFLFQNIYFLHGFFCVSSVPISNIWIIKKGARLNFAMGGQSAQIRHCRSEIKEFDFNPCV